MTKLQCAIFTELKCVNILTRDSLLLVYLLAE